MLKNSKIYALFSHMMPYLVGFGSGSGFAFLVTLIPKVKDLHTAWIVLITLGIVLMAMLISYLIFKVIIPNHNSTKMYNQFRQRKLDEIIGLVDADLSAEEIKTKFLEFKEATNKRRNQLEKQKLAAKSASKTEKAANIFDGN